jgi:hypothetical protein
LAGVPAFSFTGEISPKIKKKKVLKKKLQNSKIKWFFRASLQSPEVRVEFFFNSQISSFGFLYVARNIEG